MINKQELIQTLKKQHRVLQSSLNGVLEKTQSMALDESINLLVKFKKDLTEHLELENSTFYPDYMRINHDQEKIKKFVDEMILIGKKVMDFLDKYNNIEKISMAKEIFLTELSDIIITLNLRIEMEEEGLYDIYIVS